MSTKNNDLLIKKLYFRASHRGMKEMDLLLGNYAKENLNKMTTEELTEFEKILNIPDQNIYLWYMNKQDIPQEFNSKTLSNILKYKISE